MLLIDSIRKHRFPPAVGSQRSSSPLLPPPRHTELDNDLTPSFYDEETLPRDVVFVDNVVPCRVDGKDQSKDHGLDDLHLHTVEESAT